MRPHTPHSLDSGRSSAGLRKIRTHTIRNDARHTHLPMSRLPSTQRNTHTHTKRTSHSAVLAAVSDAASATHAVCAQTRRARAEFRSLYRKDAQRERSLYTQALPTGLHHLDAQLLSVMTSRTIGRQPPHIDSSASPTLLF